MNISDYLTIGIIICSIIFGFSLGKISDIHKMNNYLEQVNMEVYKVQQDCKNAYNQEILIKKGETRTVIEFIDKTNYSEVQDE